MNGILFLNKYKPASVGEFLVWYQREFDKFLARENKFVLLHYTVWVVAKFLQHPVYESHLLQSISSVSLVNSWEKVLDWA